MTILDLLLAGDVEGALAEFNIADESEKEKCLVAISKKLQPPTHIALLERELKPGSTFQDFYQAWKPEIVPYYHLPVRVFNAVNVSQSDEIVSVGFIYCSDDEKLSQEMQRTAETDALRGERIGEISDKVAENKFCIVKSDDVLGSDF